MGSPREFFRKVISELVGPELPFLLDQEERDLLLQRSRSLVLKRSMRAYRKIADFAKRTGARVKLEKCGRFEIYVLPPEGQAWADPNLDWDGTPEDFIFSSAESTETLIETLNSVLDRVSKGTKPKGT
jgi:hypothetical protein